LGQLEDGDEEFVFLTLEGHADWLIPFIGSNSRIVSEVASRPDSVRSLVGKAPPIFARFLRVAAGLLGSNAISVPRSSGVFESTGAKAVHFPAQNAFLTAIPSIYQPWDLLHAHHPEYFTRYERNLRDVRYRQFCQQAQIVVVASRWAKEDLIASYGIEPLKIHVVPVPPPITAYPKLTKADLTGIRGKFSLPDQYIIYPAQTWPHKNHVKLLEALAKLRDEAQLCIPLVLTGRHTEFVSTIRKTAAHLRLQEQVHFLEFVTPAELSGLLTMSRAMVFPSRFEGWGLPIVEAYSMGIPVGCSNVESLTEQAHDCALVFDPDSPSEIMETIRTLWTDEAARIDLAARGMAKVAKYNWRSTASAFRELYRIAAGPLPSK